MDSMIRRFFQMATLTGTYIAWAIVLIILFFTIPQYRTELFSIALINSIMLVPVFVIKHTTKRNRPDFKDTRFGAVAFDKFSFPSGHATRATFTMILMALITPDYTWLWIIWGLTMIISRLILGVHYITDIFTGILLSSSIMLIFYLLGWLPIFPGSEELASLFS